MTEWRTNIQLLSFSLLKLVKWILWRPLKTIIKFCYVWEQQWIQHRITFIPICFARPSKVEYQPCMCSFLSSAQPIVVPAHCLPCQPNQRTPQPSASTWNQNEAIDRLWSTSTQLQFPLISAWYLDQSRREGGLTPLCRRLSLTAARQRRETRTRLPLREEELCRWFWSVVVWQHPEYFL